MKTGNELFFYTFNPLILQPGTTETVIVNTDSDAPFQADAFMGWGLVGAVETDFLIQFRNDTTGRNIQGQPTLSRLVLTNAQALNPNPVKYYIGEKASISASVSNFSAGVLTVYLSMRGYKIFKTVKG